MAEVDDYIDETAISRALAGDASVWPHLTRLERREAVVRASARRRSELGENAEWIQIMRTSGRGARYNAEAPAFLPHPQRCHPQWLVDVARAAGYPNPSNLLRQARRWEADDREASPRQGRV